MIADPVTYRLHVADYVRLNRRICMRLLVRNLAGLLLAMGLLLAALDDWHLVPFDWPPLAGGAGAALLLILLYPFVIVPRRARRIFNEQASLAEMMTLTLDEQALHVDQLSGSLHYGWEKFVKWDESDNLLMLYVNRLSFLWLSQDDIGEDRFAYIRDRLIASGLPQAGKLRK